MSLKTLYEDAKKDSTKSKDTYLFAGIAVIVFYGLLILLINVVWNIISPLFNLPHLTYLQMFDVLLLGILVKYLYNKIR